MNKQHRYLMIIIYAYVVPVGIDGLPLEKGESGYQCCKISLTTNNKNEAQKWKQTWKKRFNLSVYDTKAKRALII